MMRFFASDTDVALAFPGRRLERAREDRGSSAEAAPPGALPPPQHTLLPSLCRGGHGSCRHGPDLCCLFQVDDKEAAFVGSAPGVVLEETPEPDDYPKPVTRKSSTDTSQIQTQDAVLPEPAAEDPAAIMAASAIEHEEEEGNGDRDGRLAAANVDHIPMDNGPNPLRPVLSVDFWRNPEMTPTEPPLRRSMTREIQGGGRTRRRQVPPMVRSEGTLL